MQKFNLERQITTEPITVKGPNGESIEAILGIFSVTKTFQGVTKVNRFVTVGNTPDGVFNDSNVRLYLPIRNSYEPTDEELIKLFTGESVFIKDLPKKDGSTYSASFVFDMWAERTFKSRYGTMQKPNFTGELKFAPRKSKKQESEGDFW